MGGWVAQIPRAVRGCAGSLTGSRPSTAACRPVEDSHHGGAGVSVDDRTLRVLTDFPGRPVPNPQRRGDGRETGPYGGAHIVQAPRPGCLGFGADEGTAESESCLFIRRDVARAAEPASTDSRIRLLRDCRL